MSGVVLSFVVTLVFFVLIIVSSVKYGTGTYKYCNLTYQGHITQMNVAYLHNKEEAIVSIGLDIYKMMNEKIRFIEPYKIVTNLQEAAKYNLRSAYDNSTIVNLYKNCEYELNPARIYHFEDIEYLEGSIWQSILAYCLVASLISAVVSGFCIFEACFKKPKVTRYTSADFSNPNDMDPLSESQKPKIKILGSF